MILITGSPRSGLSLITDYFLKLGLTTSEFATPNNSFEDPAVASINNDILRIAGCSWNNVPNGITLTTNGSMNYRIANFLTKHPDIDFLKDPRFAFTWQIWEAVAKDIDLFVMFREPGECALSIRRIFGGYAAEAASIWQQHNIRLASQIGTFVEFGADIDFEEFNDNVARAMWFLDIAHYPNYLDKVYDEKNILTTTSTAVPPAVQKTYHLLKSRKDN